MTQPLITGSQTDIDLGDLADVGGVGSPADGDVLTWDDAQSRWEARVAAGGIVPAAGDVGSYALTIRTDAGGTLELGDTLSGADMEPAHAGGNGSGTALSGTWQCMGYALQGVGNSEGATSLWVRIA